MLKFIMQVLDLMVPGAGIEPARPYKGRGILSCFKHARGDVWKQRSTKNQRFKRRRGQRICSNTRAVGLKHPQLFALLFISLPSFGEGVYLTAGGGISRHETNGSDGVWVQKAFDHSIQSNSWAGHAGAGIQVNRWLAVEGLYHDFGKTKISSDFVFPDENYSRDSPTGCTGKCNPIAHGEGTGRATGISLSLMPSYQIDRDWYIYSRLGLLWYKRKWEEKITCCKAGSYKEGDAYGPRMQDAFAPSLEQQTSGEYLFRGTPGVPANRSGRALLWGVGVSYRSLRLEYMGTKGIVAPGSGHTNLGTLTVAYRLQF